MSLHTLSYVGFNATDLDDWRQYATGVLGMQVVDQTDDALRLRMDEKHHRFAIHKSAAPGFAYSGWDVATRAELDRLTAELMALGYPATEGTQDERAFRKVVDLRVFTDPGGNRVELFYGQLSGCPFTPARQFAGFKTGELGLGHIVFMTANMDAMMAFYGVLGLSVSDYIFIKPVQSRACFMHLNARHHSFALLGGPQDVFHHIMIEVNSLDDVGMGNELALRQGRKVTMSLGKHTNDHVVSFYTQTPSGFELEYGCGGRTIDNLQDWQVVEYDDISFWGHLGPLRAPV
jgi:2,3-dihydroxybiphenyl 1,2-dioxygenase